MKKLAIISTHPIQYNAPLFRLLALRKNIYVKVFYTWSQLQHGKKFDPGFGKTIEWDIPLLDGYEYTFVENISAQPGSHHFKGIVNPSLTKEIEEWGANALMVYGWNFKSHFKAMRFFKNKMPVLFRGDSTLLDETSGLKKIIRRTVLKYIYSFVDVAFYAGVANKAYFAAHGFKEKQLVFMPHAIDNKRFANSIENIAAAKKLRNDLDIPLDATVFLFVGKLENKKQPDFLLASFAALNVTHSFLLVIGSGELEVILKQTYIDYKNIIFLGFQNQLAMPAFYNACNVLILPSKGPSETWGLAINEAMAAGKAIIASKACGAVYDLVLPDYNGFIIPTNSTVALTNAMLHFINNATSAELMGANSLSIINQYTYEADCLAIEATLNSIPA